MDSVRYAPDTSFPAYAFVPGENPHPTSDPCGHSFGKPHDEIERLDPENPKTSLAYRIAIDLFNAGFYWEAHEAWEELWIAAGKSGLPADFIKGLIKLAAAGVKVRQRQPSGVLRHARRAQALFHSVRAKCPESQSGYAGLSFVELHQIAESFLTDLPAFAEPTYEPQPVIQERLVLREMA